MKRARTTTPPTQGRSAEDRLRRHVLPPMTPKQFRRALDAIAKAEVNPWDFDTFCRLMAIRPDMARAWMRGDRDISGQTRTMMIGRQAAEARGLVYAAHHAAKQQEDAYVSHGN